MGSNRQEAKQLLVHYFETCFRLAGVRFESDNRAAVEQIIDAIFDEISELGTAVLNLQKPTPADHDKDPEMIARDLALEALWTDGGHHKQWYLERIFETLGGDLAQEAIGIDRGIAP